MGDPAFVAHAGTGGMTQWRAVIFVRSHQMEWTEAPQVPPLRYASVGMTSCGAVTFIRSGQIGWTEETAGPRSTTLRAGSPLRYASVLRQARTGGMTQV